MNDKARRSPEFSQLYNEMQKILLINIPSIFKSEALSTQVFSTLSNTNIEFFYLWKELGDNYFTHLDSRSYALVDWSLDFYLLVFKFCISCQLGEPSRTICGPWQKFWKKCDLKDCSEYFRNVQHVLSFVAAKLEYNSAFLTPILEYLGKASTIKPAVLKSFMTSTGWQFDNISLEEVARFLKGIFILD